MTDMCGRSGEEPRKASETIRIVAGADGLIKTKSGERVCACLAVEWRGGPCLGLDLPLRPNMAGQ